MSPSISLVPAGASPCCPLVNEDTRRTLEHGADAARRIAAVVLRVVLALAMAGLGAAQPRLLPLFALTLPFWLAIELEGKVKPRG